MKLKERLVRAARSRSAGTTTDELRPRTNVAAGAQSPNLFRMRNGTAYDHQAFSDYLTAVRNAAGLKTDADLWRASGVRHTIISRWRSGEMRPSHENLAKIAVAVGVPTSNLWIMAGLVTPAEVGLEDQPDLTVIPNELRELVNLITDPRLTTAQREQVTNAVRVFTAGIRATVAEAETPQPRKPKNDPRRAAG